MEKVWRCVECVTDYRAATGPVQWQFAPVRHAERRILAHLMSFHDLPTSELKAAKLNESEYSGSLIFGNRPLAVWSRSEIAREDVHRVGNWLSDVLKHKPIPRVRPPY
jgi:hypothetical protein